MNSENSISLKVVFEIFWAKKIFITLTSFLIGFFSILYSLSIPNEYKASAVLISSSLDQNSLSPSSSSFAGGDFIGKSLGLNYLEGVPPDTKIAIEILTSRGFIEDFVTKYNLLPYIIAAEKWDSNKNEIVFKEDLYDATLKKWSNDFNKNSITSTKIYKEFKKRLKILINSNTGFVEISFEYFSPYIAKECLENLINEINIHMAKRKSVQSKLNLEFLERTFVSTRVQNTRDIISDLIKKEISKKMVSEASPNYSFSIVSKVMLPEIKSKPKRSFIVIVLTSLGVFTILMIILGLYFIKKDN